MFCRRHGVSAATFYKWKAMFKFLGRGVGVEHVRRIDTRIEPSNVRNWHFFTVPSEVWDGPLLGQIDRAEAVGMTRPDG